MALIGFHFSHENHRPGELLRYAKLAEEAGFQAGMCSDHIAPWREDGQSGFAWSWLGAALEATTLSFGMVTAPVQRYHPAIIAQAAATLAEMYPERLWCAFGSGQNLNEHITGEKWPDRPTRNARLREAVEVIRALWAGETVTHFGLVTVEEAKLYTLPAQPPLALGAALTAETAEWMGNWVDGIMTTAKPPEEQRKFIESFRRGGGAGKPMFLQSMVAYAEDLETARRGAWQQWRNNTFGSRIQSNLKTPQEFDSVGQKVRPEDMESAVRISTDLDQHVEWLREDIRLGFDRIYVYSATPDQLGLIEAYGTHVLPALRQEVAAGA